MAALTDVVEALTTDVSYWSYFCTWHNFVFKSTRGLKTVFPIWILNEISFVWIIDKKHSFHSIVPPLTIMSNSHVKGWDSIEKRSFMRNLIARMLCTYCLKSSAIRREITLNWQTRGKHHIQAYFPNLKRNRFAVLIYISHIISDMM